MNTEKAFCVKCGHKVMMKEPRQIKMRNGRHAIKGRCSKCGTPVYKILPRGS